MKTIEAEVRSFLSDAQYHELLSYFQQHGEFNGQDEQETHYFDCQEDIRIQKNLHYSKIWMKKGKIHDEAREEIEVQCQKEDFDKLQKIFTSIGLRVKIKWFRKRLAFLWDGITVTIDDTKGYGKIIELEKMCSEEEKEKTIHLLKKKLDILNVQITPREEFEKKFSYYEKNWETLTRE
jgi:predicted adenylyl cyclase CyaB